MCIIPPGRYLFRIPITRIPVFQASRFAIRWFNCQTPTRIDHPLAGATFGPVDDWSSRIACCLQGDIAIVGCAFAFSVVVLPHQFRISVGVVCSESTFSRVSISAQTLIRHLSRIGWPGRIPRFFRLRLVGRHQRTERYGQDSGQKRLENLLGGHGGSAHMFLPRCAVSLGLNTTTSRGHLVSALIKCPRLPFAKWAPPQPSRYFPTAIGTSSESEVIA